MLARMTFREWQHFTPAAAAREIHARLEARLSPAQRRATVAHLLPEAELAAQLAAPPRSAPLRGVPCIVKDLFPVAGEPMLAGSTFLPEVRPAPAADGAFVRAVRASGAAIAGRSHMHEFAYGITGENPHYGDCERPHFPGRTTGGSSSGSAALVAAGVVPLALGSDTGGSVRVPAAFCGLFGFRLTPHDTWIRDGFPLSPSFDTAGWFTANADDMRTALATLIGVRTGTRPPRGCYLELPGCDPEVALACRGAVERFAAPAEAPTRFELLEGFARGAEIYNAIVAREAWAVHAAWAERYRERYDPGVWQRLIRIRQQTPEQFAAAEKGAEAMRQLWLKFFLTFDFLVMPATPTPALTKAECTLENRMRLLTLTAPASIGGLPVLTIPVPLASGLTTGLQIIVNHPQSPVVSWALERA